MPASCCSASQLVEEAFAVSFLSFLAESLLLSVFEDESDVEVSDEEELLSLEDDADVLSLSFFFPLPEDEDERESFL
jgi:hypothetical protein